MAITDDWPIERTLEERLEFLELTALTHEFMLHRALALVATIAPDPQACADLLRSECDEHFRSLEGLDPAKYQDFEGAVDCILGNALGERGTAFMPISPAAGR